MSSFETLTLAVSAAMFVYLLVAMLFPDRFT